MEYRDEREHLKARESIVARRPGNLRVEVNSPFGVALIILIDSDRLEIFDPGKSVLMYGSATPATLERFARIPLDPPATVGLLMGLAPDSDHLQLVRARVASDGTTVLTYRDGNGRVRETSFAGGELVKVRTYANDGSIALEVRYADYRDIGGIEFPYRIEANFPAEGSSLKLAYQRPIVNDPVADSTFSISPTGTIREIDLDKQPLMPMQPRG
jgi:hypothetical protein